MRSGVCDIRTFTGVSCRASSVSVRVVCFFFLLLSVLSTFCAPQEGASIAWFLSSFFSLFLGWLAGALHAAPRSQCRGGIAACGRHLIRYDQDSSFRNGVPTYTDFLPSHGYILLSPTLTTEIRGRSCSAATVLKPDSLRWLKNRKTRRRGRQLAGLAVQSHYCGKIRSGWRRSRLHTRYSRGVHDCRNSSGDH
jgi:hypothetical protein